VSDFGERHRLVPDAQVNGQCSKSQSVIGRKGLWEKGLWFLNHCMPVEERIPLVLEMSNENHFHAF
jgi:hypothetical protein